MLGKIRCWIWHQFLHFKHEYMSWLALTVNHKQSWLRDRLDHVHLWAFFYEGSSWLLIDGGEPIPCGCGCAIPQKGGPELYKMLTKHEVWKCQEPLLVPASSSCSDFTTWFRPWSMRQRNPFLPKLLLKKMLSHSSRMKPELYVKQCTHDPQGLFLFCLSCSLCKQGQVP